MSFMIYAYSTHKIQLPKTKRRDNKNSNNSINNTNQRLRNITNL